MNKDWLVIGIPAIIGLGTLFGSQPASRDKEKVREDSSKMGNPARRYGNVSETSGGNAGQTESSLRGSLIDKFLKFPVETQENLVHRGEEILAYLGQSPREGNSPAAKFAQFPLKTQEKLAKAGSNMLKYLGSNVE